MEEPKRKSIFELCSILEDKIAKFDGVKQDYLLWLADLVHNFDDEQAKKDQEYLISDKFY